MEKEFLPYQESKDLQELGFKEKCAAHYLGEDDLELKWKIYRNLSIDTNSCLQAPTYRQAFRFLREKYDLRGTIGSTNIVVCHIPISDYHTTQLLQNNASYEDAELATIKYFIEVAKQRENG